MEKKLSQLQIRNEMIRAAYGGDEGEGLDRIRATRVRQHPSINERETEDALLQQPPLQRRNFDNSE